MCFFSDFESFVLFYNIFIKMRIESLALECYNLSIERKRS